jgi:hypothetical protein
VKLAGERVKLAGERFVSGKNACREEMVVGK